MSGITSSAIPEVGNIVPHAAELGLDGYLKCNGSAISRATYAVLFAAIGTLYGVGDGVTTFNIPDFRGEFLRGADDGAGVDAGRVFGSWQADELKSHTHPVNSVMASGGGYCPYSNIAGIKNINTGATGGTETRPRNIALHYWIKY